MGADRGQTQQDFAVGVSVFLLAVLFVFGFVPTTIGTTGTAVESTAYQADRTVSAILANITEENGSAQVLNETKTSYFFTNHSSGEEIAANYSLPRTAKVNVSIETLEGVQLNRDDRTAGERFRDQPDAAAATRIVWLNDVRYRLVVRVWQ